MHLRDFGIFGKSDSFQACYSPRFSSYRAQSRQAIQTLDEARDAIQALYIGNTYIMSGSVDGHIRTYDLRKGELRADYLGSTYLLSTLKKYNRIYF